MYVYVCNHVVGSKFYVFWPTKPSIVGGRSLIEYNTDVCAYIVQIQREVSIMCTYTYMYMNNHMHSAPQLERKKRTKKKERRITHYKIDNNLNSLEK